MLKRIRDLLGRLNRSTTIPPGLLDKTKTAGSEAPRLHVGPTVTHRPIPLSDIDPDAVKIVRRLTRFDHTAYLVGGCVRDLLLDRRPKDFDIGTTATPRQVRRLFRNCRIIGRRFRLAHIYFQNGKIIEVATFRARDLEQDVDADSGEGDLLVRDDNVFGTPEEDALRRDFTINALFYDVNAQTVLDHADGLGDLRQRRIRTIGDPEIRFREDPIRALRAVKFAARLGFSIEPETLGALRRTRNLVPKAAPPRILEEINRFCRGGAGRKSFELLRETGLLEVVLPELAVSYRENPRAQSLLEDLLDAVDRRHEKGQEVSTGVILAILLLPTVVGKMGWKEDGTASPARGDEIREAADEALKPLAARLRVSRRDQEECRQIIATLHRMVPADRIRRGARQAILRRPCARDCLWMLETVASRLGGEFERSHRYWQSGLKDAETARGARAGASRPATERSGAAPPAKRRRSRGGRRRKPEKPEPKAAAPAPKAETRRDSRAPWDFFAALPSVPELGEEDERGDRYGAEGVSSSTEDEKASTPRRRRRRRRKTSTGRSEGGSGRTPES